VPKVKEISASLKTDLALGEHLNFSSFLTLDHQKRDSQIQCQEFLTWPKEPAF
jgi:hypothetical protein